MKKLIVILIVICFGLGVVLWRNEQIQQKQARESLKQAIVSEVESKRNSSSKEMIHLQNLTNFEWDTLYIFGPYTPKEVINEKLGFTWFDVRAASIEYRDDIHLLVFVKGHDVVQYLEYPRNHGDFDDAYQVQADNADFELKKSKVGTENWLVLHHS